jgi:mono/diheme cytochrome c family protein
MKMKKLARHLAAPLTMLSLGVFFFAPSAAEEQPYQVVCEQAADTGVKVCKVDKKTYIGWRTYTASCLRCHGQDGVGSTFAPSLLDKLNEIDRERFMTSVAKGFTGQIGVMPAWEGNPNVSRYYEQLYAYLKARSDGVLPPGRPARLDD